MIDTKHLLCYIDNDTWQDEYRPKLFIDFYTLKPMPKFRWETYYAIVFRFGAFGKHLFIELKWGHIKGRDREI